MSGAQEESAFAAAWHDVTTALHAGCERHGVVGAGIAFVRGRELLGTAFHGHADRAAGRRADLDTIWHWASNTKTLTGIALLQLRDRERLRLDDPVVRWVPELRAVHDPFGSIEAITLRHLLSHSAGFRGPTWPWGGQQAWHPHEPTEWSQLVAMMPYTNVEFAPGSRFAYSNPGIVFVGRVIEQLSGDDYETYLDKNVLKPLGMHRSYFDVTPYHLQRYRSHGYRRTGTPAGGGPGARGDGDGGSLVDEGPDFDTGITVSNGGLNAPLADMVRYLAFLLGDVDAQSDAAQVLARDSLLQMWEPQQRVAERDGERQDMGLTFFVTTRGEQRWIGHTGGQKAFATFFYVHPASRTAGIGAFNTTTAGPVMAEVRQRMLQRLSLPASR